MAGGGFFAGPAALRALQPPLSDSHARVLFVLVMHARKRDRDDYRCWPSVKLIAAEAGGKSRRGVQLILRELEQAGFIDIEPGAGANGTNVYRILPGVGSEDGVGEGTGRDGASPGAPPAEGRRTRRAAGAQSRGRRGAARRAPEEKEESEETRDAAGRASHGPPAGVEDARPGAGPPPIPLCRQAMQSATAAQRGMLAAHGVADAHGLRGLFGDGDRWGWTRLDLLRAAMERVEEG